uniref:Alpha-soluble NSF attachment protein n=1 Tax=Hemiselmis tepida TaxID=464990 RepID=A0A7S0VZQ9_9CRYP|mmetsp:Transcript_33364/g.85544  ORF Transcript_33364/g.85544 Transcript_33364/m.85544 type:complete len:290 (+) Transcript_33364:50-919(+)|eukprot:CAMPEP_0174927430 /NCGR_PEP_ID=MMETSP1355-20121228/18127_1 /TAXON_ID=464990 /ORGANISM="Hemiselmis tepida, Strain CCMP443" /LENGTH=289 /DNA_ID=CAMNT_0016173529 /DNA_START=41 /DNA_END=910 /DNA_ORIENTATION=+
MAEEAALELVAKAEKKLKGGMFGNMFGSKKEDAVELLQEAANKFKQVKNFAQCGEMHKRVAELQMELNDKFSAATSFQAAFQAYKKDDGCVKVAVECLSQAIELHINNGRFSQAAKFHKEAGELYESELNYQKAIEHFQSAGDYYKGEDQTSSGNQCLLRVAVLSAELEDYKRAIEVFESVAASSLDVALLKWSVKDYFFQAGLCHIANRDVVSARRAIDRYQDQDVSFSDTRECTLLKELLEATDEADVEKFTNAVFEYDQISKLDKWKTTVLLRIKTALSDAESDMR